MVFQNRKSKNTGGSCGPELWEIFRPVVLFVLLYLVIQYGCLLEIRHLRASGPGPVKEFIRARPGLCLAVMMVVPTASALSFVYREGKGGFPPSGRSVEKTAGKKRERKRRSGPPWPQPPAPSASFSTPRSRSLVWSRIPSMPCSLFTGNFLFSLCSFSQRSLRPLRRNSSSGGSYIPDFAAAWPSFHLS